MGSSSVPISLRKKPEEIPYFLGPRFFCEMEMQKLIMWGLQLGILEFRGRDSASGR